MRSDFDGFPLRTVSLMTLAYHFFRGKKKTRDDEQQKQRLFQKMMRRCAAPPIISSSRAVRSRPPTCPPTRTITSSRPPRINSSSHRSIQSPIINSTPHRAHSSAYSFERSPPVIKSASEHSSKYGLLAGLLAGGIIALYMNEALAEEEKAPAENASAEEKASWRQQIVGKYENRLREFSTPEKLFQVRLID